MIVEKRNGGVLASQSTSGAVGKGLVAVGGSAIVLSVLAALVPFVGVLGLGVIFVVLGMFLWE